MAGLGGATFGGDENSIEEASVYDFSEIDRKHYDVNDE